MGEAGMVQQREAVRRIAQAKHLPPGLLAGQCRVAHLLDAFKGGVAVAVGAQGVGHAVRPRHGAQQQFKLIEGARQPLV